MTRTEMNLKFWRGDQIGAERLSATVLHIEGFSSIDPQCPLGGPDGLKDVLCEKNGWKYVAAAYFPTSEKTLSEVKAKFVHDLDGVGNNKADGIVFLTNQALTPTERQVLIDEADGLGHKSIIYHLERLRALLDSPSGYGVRLEFLDIEMTREEQLSFFTQWNRSFADQLQAHALVIIRELGNKIDALAGSNAVFGDQIMKMGGAIKQTQSILARMVPPSDKRVSLDRLHGVSTRNLTTEQVCLIHRALLFDSPIGSQVGGLRTVKLWIGSSGSPLSAAAFVPPEPELVPELLDELLAGWRSSYEKLSGRSEAEKISAISVFHHRFVSIHPFVDGNGRIARFLLAQQVTELLNQNRRVVIEDRRPYFDALAAADKGDFALLETVVSQAIRGVEFVAGSPCQMSGQPCPVCGEGIMDINPVGTGVRCSACGIDLPAA